MPEPPATLPVAERLSIAIAFLLPPLVILATPDSARLFALSCGLAALLLDAVRQLARDRRLTLDGGDLALGLLISYAALSLAWSPDWRAGIQGVMIGAAGLLLIAWAKHWATPRHLTAFAWGVAAACTAVQAEYFLSDANQWGGFGNRGYLAETLTLGLPFLLVPGITGGRMARTAASVLASVVVLFLVLFGNSAIPLFACLTLLAVGSVFLAFRARRSWGFAAAALWLAVPAILALLAWERLDLSRRLLIRLELTIDTAIMASKAPLFGHGAGSFVALYPLFKEAHQAVFPYFNMIFSAFSTQAEAAHNELLQLAAELGLIGLALFGLLAVMIVRAARGRVTGDRFVAAGVLALIVVLAEGLLDYPLQRAATLFLGLGAVGFACHGRPPGLPRRQISLSLPALGLVGFVLAGAAGGLAFAGYRAEIAGALYREARGGRHEPSQALAEAYEAYRINPLDREARVSLPVFLDAVTRLYGANAVPPETVRQIYAIAQSAGPYNTVVLIGRAQQLLNAGRADDPALLDILDALKRGSSHVPAAYVIEARYDMAHGDAPAALSAIEQGRALATAALGVDETAPGVLAVLASLEAQIAQTK